MSGKGPYILRGNQKYHIVKSELFDIDAASSATADDVLFANLPFDIYIEKAQIVYYAATDTAGAEDGSVKVGTTAGGVEVVAETNFEVSKAVGSTTNLTLVKNRIASGSSLFCRWTGVAATQVGKVYLEVTYRIM